VGYYGSYGWKSYVSVGERRRKAEREKARLLKRGGRVSPVVLEGRTIARTFWGTAWCDNLERYSDYENRLPRGRAYVRNGLVVDLQVASGEVRALVSGSSMYKVSVKVAAVPRARWTSLCRECAGSIDSLVELLQGRFSKGVMERLCRQKTGLFPAPSELEFSCSCPDWASMCKHVAAVLYGIGTRLDGQPELLFKLRKVDGSDLIAGAGKRLPLSNKAPAGDKVLVSDDLAGIFGLELGTSGVRQQLPTPMATKKPARTRAKQKKPEHKKKPAVRKPAARTRRTRK
jgi:uncharacterized Zn finger protein